MNLGRIILYMSWLHVFVLVQVGNLIHILPVEMWVLWMVYYLDNWYLGNLMVQSKK
jgi:hypothetical protein